MEADSAQTSGGSSKANIFISYSRKDASFVDRLEAALKARGFAPYIDRQNPVAEEDWSKGIAPFADWWDEIKRMIAQADTVVFVISPDSIASTYCQHELAEAAKLNRRLAPILHRGVDSAIVPGALQRRQRIDFTDDRRFEDNVATLAVTLETDIDWVRKHKEITIAAQKWDLYGRPLPHGLLLRPPPLNDWEKWLGLRPSSGAPEPTDAARAFIAASRQAYDEEQAAIAASQVNLLALVSDGERERGNLDTALKVCIHAVKEAQRRNVDPAAAGASLAAAVFESKLRLALDGREPVFSPHGRLVATIFGRGVAVWDSITGRKIAFFREEEGTVHSIAFSPDESSLLMTSGVFTVKKSAGGHFTLGQTLREVIARVWDIGTETEISALRTNAIGSKPAVSFNLDGECVVTASSDNSANVRDVATGNEIAVLHGHSGPLGSVAFDPDGSRIITASEDRTARIWDAKTGKQLAVLRGHTAAVTNAVFSSNGKFVATTSLDGSARIWDAATARLCVVLLDEDSRCFFSPDCRFLCTASRVNAFNVSLGENRGPRDNVMRVWTMSGKQIAALRGHEDVVECAAFTGDGRRLITANKTAHIWTLPDVDNRTKNYSHWWVRVQASAKRALSWFVGPTIIRSGSSSLLRDTDRRLTPDAVAALRGHKHTVTHAAFCPDGSRLVTASQGDEVRIWDTSTKELVLRGHGDAVKSAAFSPDGNYIVTASRDRTARIWEVVSGKEIAILEHESMLTSAAFSPDGARIVTAWGGGHDRPQTTIYGARIWDVATKSVIAGHGTQLHLHMRSRRQSFVAGEVRKDAVMMETGTASFTPDGKRIITASGRRAEFWDARTGRHLNEIPIDEDVMFAGLSPDGTSVVLIVPGSVRIWSIPRRCEIGGLRMHNEGVYSAVFSPDGTRIVTAAINGTARVWDVATEREISHVTGESMFSAGFSPDGTRIVTASKDMTARIWDAATTKKIAELRGHDNAVLCAALSPDGSRLVTASADKTARVWDVHFATMSTKNLIDEVCSRRLRGLTRLARDEMRLSGYPDTVSEIDVAEGTEPEN